MERNSLLFTFITGRRQYTLYNPVCKLIRNGDFRLPLVCELAPNLLTYAKSHAKSHFVDLENCCFRKFFWRDLGKFSTNCLTKEMQYCKQTIQVAQWIRKQVQTFHIVLLYPTLNDGSHKTKYIVYRIIIPFTNFRFILVRSSYNIYEQNETNCEVSPQTCVMKTELDTVRFTFKLVVSGVVELVRVHHGHTISSAHQVHQ